MDTNLSRFTSTRNRSPGDAFDARLDEDEGVLTFRRVRRGKGWLNVLKACPVPMDDLPSRRRE